MATQSPFSLLEDILQKRSFNFQPPVWVVDEVQRRVVLLLNHILMQEKEATRRLARQKGLTVLFQWREFTLQLVATPAGLLDRASSSTSPDLTFTVTEASPMVLAQGVMRGDKPAIQIVGDVQLASEVNWLIENVRWDVEEDLSRIVGDAPAHAIGQVARRMAAALREFLARRPGQPSSHGLST
jgi:ubiquinone biosynthesis accessory factor UbiJ